MNTSKLSELDRVKLKIKALTSKTVANGCSEAEAMSAMTAVGRLLGQYNLSMSELDVRQSAYKTVVFYVDRENRHPTLDACATALARLIDGKTYFHREYVKVEGELHRLARKANGRPKKRAGYAFFGTEQDLEYVGYLFDVIKAAVATEAGAFKQTDDYKATKKTAEVGRSGAKTALTSFQRGFGGRVSQRLNDLKKENDKVYEEALKTEGESVEIVDIDPVTKSEVTRVIKKPRGMNLIVLKGQLCEEEFKKTGTRLRTTYTYHRRHDFNAYGKGFAAGDKVNLSRPVGNDKPNGYLS